MQHVLNGICPYYTMFPLTFPLRLLAKQGKPGQWILDPFCGRGTTNLAARLLGHPSVGIDSSPVAVAIAAAKIATTTLAGVARALDSILSRRSRPYAPEGEFW